jgi:Protein of unknown function (DUF3151)
MVGSPGNEVSPVQLSGGLPETILPEEPADVLTEIAAGMDGPPELRWEAVGAVARRAPRSIAAWAALGQLAVDDLVTYACFRVGYHRGLDALRASGWRGSGLVRWEHEPNRAFLSCLDGLRGAAAAIGESDEERRCEQFLAQLDPSRPSIPHGSTG